MESGIYSIFCTGNEKTYIGSSVNIDKRFRAHKSKLRTNKHANPHLQSAYNKYGEKKFEYSVVEYCEKEKLIEREQYYLDNVSPEFNIRKIAESNLGVPLSESAKKKLSEFWTGKKKPPRSEEHRMNMSRVKKGVFIGRKIPQHQIDFLKESRKGEDNPMWGKPSTRRKKVYIWTPSYFWPMEICESVREAANMLGCCRTNIPAIVNRGGFFNGMLLTYDS